MSNHKDKEDEIAAFNANYVKVNSPEYKMKQKARRIARAKTAKAKMAQMMLAGYRVGGI